MLLGYGNYFTRSAPPVVEEPAFTGTKGPEVTLASGGVRRERWAAQHGDWYVTFLRAVAGPMLIVKIQRDGNTVTPIPAGMGPTGMTALSAGENIMTLATSATTGICVYNISGGVYAFTYSFDNGSFSNLTTPQLLKANTPNAVGYFDAYWDGSAMILSTIWTAHAVSVSDGVFTVGTGVLPASRMGSNPTRLIPLESSNSFISFMRSSSGSLFAIGTRNDMTITHQYFPGVDDYYRIAGAGNGYPPVAISDLRIVHLVIVSPTISLYVFDTTLLPASTSSRSPVFTGTFVPTGFLADVTYTLMVAMGDDRVIVFYNTLNAGVYQLEARIATIGASEMTFSDPVVYGTHTAGGAVSAVKVTAGILVQWAATQKVFLIT
jgi:hypothetical protein